ncbi:hypothetical protein OH492_26740 [Vibrio chagasii]|nr:hypothetical protein [Vibrio chagasii]
MSTLHANTLRDAIARVESLCDDGELKSAAGCDL